MKDHQPYWIERTETRLYPRRALPFRPPLPFEIIYTNIVLVWKTLSACATTQIKTQHNIDVYDFKWLRRSNWLRPTWVATVLFQLLKKKINRPIQYSWLFLNWSNAFTNSGCATKKLTVENSYGIFILWAYSQERLHYHVKIIIFKKSLPVRQSRKKKYKKSTKAHLNTTTSRSITLGHGSFWKLICWGRLDRQQCSLGNTRNQLRLEQGVAPGWIFWAERFVVHIKTCSDA